VDEILELTIQNQIAEISEVYLRFEVFAEQLQLPSQIVGTMQIVFEELLSNIIKHSYSDEERHEIVIKVQVFADRVRVIIIDDGMPFNPLDAETPDTTLSLEEREIGGLGIHMVRTMMDSISYERDVNKNVATVVKNISSEEG
jgi:anti-sigma regulatory factor (Ser/Thr protein kinase)